jgi:hypothetical protein
MNAFADLHRAVQATLASKRLGRPVFVRCRLEGEKAIERLPGVAELIAGWLGQPLASLHAAGSQEGGVIALTLRCREGGTALISVAPRDHSAAIGDLILLGNRGVAYFEPFARLSDNDLLGREQPKLRLTKLIRQALQSGRAEAVEGRP